MAFANLAQDSPQEAPKEVSNSLRQQRNDQFEKVEKDLAIQFLKQTGGNVSAAAKLADIPRRTFYRMLDRSGIDPALFRRQA